MKQRNLTKGLVVFLTIMITLFCGVMPSAWATNGCNYCDNVEEFEGCYGFSHDGRMMELHQVSGQQMPPSKPMASVGVFYAVDEIISGHEMVMFGDESFPADLSGTYEVNSDCTGTLWICATPEGMAEGIMSEISFVISGDEIQMVTTKMTYCLYGSVPTDIGAAIPLNIVGFAKKQCTLTP